MNYNDLIKKFKKHLIDIYETNSIIHEIGSIEFNKIDELLQFAKKNKIESAFYNYVYINEDDMKIDEDVISKLNLDKDICDILKNNFDEYNEKVEMLDFSRPISLEICFAYQGIIYYLIEDDYWYEDDGFSRPEIVAMQIFNENFDEIINKRTEDKEKIYIEREKLKSRILNDEKFHKCTNDSLRRTYVDELFKEDRSLNDLFFSPNGTMYDIPVFRFVNNIWREYKESLKLK
jgi:hypothetical protein